MTSQEIPNLSIFRPTYFDREYGTLVVNFWPLFRPRQTEGTRWGAVNLFRPRRPTGIELMSATRFLHDDLLKVLPDYPGQDSAPARSPAEGPASYYDRSQESRVVLWSEVVDETEGVEKEDAPWGAVIRAVDDLRPVGVEIVEGPDYFPADLLGCMPRVGQSQP